MNLYLTLITIVIQIKLNYAFYDQFVQDRFGLNKYVLDLSNVDITARCDYKKEKCIFKCCPEGQIIERFKSCAPSKIGISNVTVYDKELKASNKTLGSAFKLVPALMKDNTFARNSLWWYRNVYLVEDGKLLMKFPNVHHRWKIISPNHFCVEMKIHNKEIKPVFMVEYAIEHFRQPSSFMKWALIISLVCMILTFTVYAILPQLRDLNGIILMIHLTCLIISTIAHACLESYYTMKLRMSGILTISFFYYFFKVSSVCLTNVMFYRLLKSRQVKDEPISTSKQLIKYSAYAIGLPFFMTSVVATIEVSDMTDMPSFITPQMKERGNFSFREIESLYYLYIPILVLLSFNWLVCFIKVVEFCKTSSHFAVVSEGNGAKTDGNFANRPIQFVKLLSVLTAFALLELSSVIFPKGTFDVSALYTMSVGPIIMLIFVWDANVWRLLIQRITSWRSKSPTNVYCIGPVLQDK